VRVNRTRSGKAAEKDRRARSTGARPGDFSAAFGETTICIAFERNSICDSEHICLNCSRSGNVRVSIAEGCGHKRDREAAPLRRTALSWYFQFPSEKIVIRSYKGVRPAIPASCYVDESAQIIGDVALGEHASVWMNAVLRGDVHEIRIGAYSNVQDSSVLHGMKQQWGVYLGEYVTVGHSVTLHGCVIEDRCLIGMGSIILNGARIGAGSIIAAGTLIPEKTVVEPGSLWMGSPGKFRRKLEDADQETIMRYATNYLGYKDEYLKER
jgi:carbonic anhydrase/acetyltransferase-like protein (isoleucine patch superfamily)